MIAVKWEPKITLVKTPDLRASIRTGVTVSASNIFAIFSMTRPVFGVALWNAMIAEGERISQHANQIVGLPGVPEYLLVTAEDRHLAIGYGFVPMGSRQRGLMHGEFRLVFMMQDEIPDSLTSVFSLDMLWQRQG